MAWLASRERKLSNKKGRRNQSFLRSRRDSNARPLSPQPSALSTELREQKAGRAGFEPAVEFYPDNRLAGGPNQPLWHLPKKCRSTNAEYEINISYSAFMLHHSSFVKAEGAGFEPTMDCSIPVFKTGAFVHSAIPPGRGLGEPLPSGLNSTIGESA